MAIAVRLRKNAYDADKPKYDFGRLTVTFRIAFPDGEVGDTARQFAGGGQAVPRALVRRQSHRRTRHPNHTAHRVGGRP